MKETRNDHETINDDAGSALFGLHVRAGTVG
jgi:hypothetical protein